MRPVPCSVDLPLQQPPIQLTVEEKSEHDATIDVAQDGNVSYAPQLLKKDDLNCVVRDFTLGKETVPTKTSLT